MSVKLYYNTVSPRFSHSTWMIGVRRYVGWCFRIPFTELGLYVGRAA